MDNRLKEIRERLLKATQGVWLFDAAKRIVDNNENMICAKVINVNNADFIANSPTDMQLLLDIIDGQQRQLEDRLEDQTNACLMCDKMDMAMLESENEQLKSELAKCKKVLGLKKNQVAYYKDLAKSNIDACFKAMDRERVLRDALTRIYNASAPDRGLTMHETTQIYCIAREALNITADKQEDTK